LGGEGAAAWACRRLHNLGTAAYMKDEQEAKDSDEGKFCWIWRSLLARAENLRSAGGQIEGSVSHDLHHVFLPPHCLFGPQRPLQEHADTIQSRSKYHPFYEYLLSSSEDFLSKDYLNRRQVDTKPPQLIANRLRINSESIKCLLQTCNKRLFSSFCHSDWCVYGPCT
jgi:hypothetical protein